MKNQSLINLFMMFFIVTYSFAQNEYNENGERSGFWVGYHENGMLKYKGEFLNGKETGLFKYYDYSGNLVIALDYTELGYKSLATLYYYDGTVKSTGQYIKKLKEGVWVYYNQNGQKIAEENFLNNNLHGESHYFYDNGMLSEKYNYVNNKKEGIAEIYYISGFINMKCSFHLDDLDGFAEFYYDKINQIESQGNYNMGAQDSIWIFYNELGDTLDIYDYTNKVSLIK